MTRSTRKYEPGEHLDPEVIGLFHDGEGAPEFLAQVEDHIRACDQCSAVLEDLRRLSEELRALPPLEAPASIRAGVAERIAAESASDTTQLLGIRELAQETAPVPAAPPSRGFPAWVGRVAALLVLAALAGGYILLETFRPPVEHLARHAEEGTVRSEEARPETRVPMEPRESAPSGENPLAKDASDERGLPPGTVAGDADAPTASWERPDSSGKKATIGLLESTDEPAEAETAISEAPVADGESRMQPRSPRATEKTRGRTKSEPFPAPGQEGGLHSLREQPLAEEAGPGSSGRVARARPATIRFVADTSATPASPGTLTLTLRGSPTGESVEALERRILRWLQSREDTFPTSVGTLTRRIADEHDRPTRALDFEVAPEQLRTLLQALDEGELAKGSRTADDGLVASESERIRVRIELGE